MHSLIAFATQWGSKYGGINSFNTDFLTAFGVAYYHSVQVVCVVASATDAEIEEARNAHVKLVPLPYPPQGSTFGAAEARVGIDELKHLGVSFTPEMTIWLGHDRITGEAAVHAAKTAGGRSALIHHMSYDHYESFAENSAVAYEKKQKQAALFREADLLLAVGPLLRDALHDLLSSPETVHLLIPGLAEIETRQAPKTFTTFMSGRLSDDAARIKQGHLGVAAFAHAHREARDNGMPEGLCNRPKIVLRGVDFEAQQSPDPGNLPSSEEELKRFAEAYADGVINLHALPFTQDRQALNQDLSSASVALMPSWHEGFGLVAWEAIAAGVPLIVSKYSGVYQLLEEKFRGAGPGCVHVIDVKGSVASPFFHHDDLKAVSTAIKNIANNPGKEREKAGRLREMLGSYTWASCAEEAMAVFGWDVRKGSIPSPFMETPTEIPSAHVVEPTISTTLPLRMPQKQWKSGGGIADSQLLRAEEAVVPFDPVRQPEIDTLNSWLDDPQRTVGIRLITGAGGLGKTRLALELCWQRILAGWQAGFIDADLVENDMATCWKSLRNLSQPLLIVIDYAETRQDVLLGLIRNIVQNSSVQPVRILLLARDGGEWWDNLPSKDPVCESLLSSYATTGPFTLPPLHSDEQERHRAYRQALNAFATTLGVPAPEVIPELSGDHFDRPLYLQMAALLALHGERPTTAEGLTRALLNHERRYWRGLLARFSWVEPERLAQQMLALATMAGGFATPKEAYSYWTKAFGKSLSNTDFSALFHILVPLYPGKQGLQAVRPDLLGEALVAQTLHQAEASDLLDAVLSNTARRSIRRHSLTIIARLSGQRMELQETLAEALVRNFTHCCQDITAVCVETPGCYLTTLAEQAFVRLAPAHKGQVAGLLEPIFREESVQLSELAFLVTHYLVEKAKNKLLKKNSMDHLNTYAVALINHSLDLQRTGRNTQALPAACEAVKHFQILYSYDRQRYESDYALALNNCAVCMSDVGRNDEALKQSKVSLEIRKGLAKRNPDRYEPDYAMSLSNYAIRLSSIGQNGEALKHVQEALEIRKELAKNNPDRHEASYAKSLNNYAKFLSDAGRDGESIRQAEKSLAIYERLAKKNLDRYEPDYALSLNNYASHLGDAGQNEEALQHAGQALAIRERLAWKNPDRYEPDYAMSLDNFASHLSDVGRDEEALQHAGQALAIWERLVQKNPDHHEPAYALSLNNHANRLSDAGRDEEALQHANLALEIREHLVQKNSRRFDEDCFSITCNVHFLNWLCNENLDGTVLENLKVVPETIPQHRRQLMELYSFFVQGCWVGEEVCKANFLASVISKWAELSISNKQQAKPYWLCAAAWCAEHAPEAIVDTDWREGWNKFVSQRRGRIPEWMKKVAQRLRFSWPELT